MLWEWKDLEGPNLIMQVWPPADILSSQRQEKMFTKTISRIQDLRKQDTFKKNNNQKVI